MCYDVFLNNCKLTTIEALSEDKALEIAVKRYGLEVDIKEVPCRHQMSYN